jgi:hypothetical protein
LPDETISGSRLKGPWGRIRSGIDTPVDRSIAMSYGSVTQMAPDSDAKAHAAREELQRIVTSRVFEDSDRLVRFLTFVVEETLAGRGGN